MAIDPRAFAESALFVIFFIAPILAVAGGVLHGELQALPDRYQTAVTALVMRRLKVSRRMLDRQNIQALIIRSWWLRRDPRKLAALIADGIKDWSCLSYYQDQYWNERLISPKRARLA